MAKSWDNLSQNYRDRLSRAGITKSGYESGSQSVTGARGHAKTPEHPQDVYKNKEKYRDYIEKKKEKVKRDGTLRTARERAERYASKPENKRKKPYWPATEETAFWNEYRNLMGLPVKGQ